MLEIYAVLWYTIYNILRVIIKGVFIWLKMKTLLIKATAATIFRF